MLIHRLEIGFSNDALEDFDAVRFQLRQADGSIPDRATVLSVASGLLKYFVEKKKSGKIFICAEDATKSLGEFKNAVEFELPKGIKII